MEGNNLNTSFYGAILVIAATLLSAIVLSYAMPEYGWRNPVYKLGTAANQP